MKRSVILVVLALIGMAVASWAGYWWGAQHSRQPSADISTVTSVPAKRKILYYRNPMGLADTSPAPKQDSMGMDYIPVYADEEAASGQLKISLDKVQKLGVRSEPATLREMARTVSAVGRFQVDERLLHTVTTRFAGYIEKLYVNATSQPVRRGQPLMQVYSPELVSAQEEYLIAWQGSQALKGGTEESQAGVDRLMEGALKRLRNWGISDSELQRLRNEGKATRTLTLYSPANGVVLEKTAIQGMRFMPGEPLYQIGDLSRLWLIAEVFEQDMAHVRVGQKVSISVDAYPGREFSGKVAYVYPTLSPETRTVPVRVDLANPGGMLKPDMYASVQLIADDGKARTLAVPDSAVIDSGTRQVVLVQHAEGLFEPREVRLGTRSDGYIEVLEGVSEGENVVVRANFLIDAESNLKAALGSFGTHGGHGGHGAATPAGSDPVPEPATGHEGH
ncbi:Cation efflux system protein CusB [Methylophilaceae bacterium]|nr:Cation efflux system protein CusB [Methylophilaceae bacterium]